MCTDLVLQSYEIFGSAQPPSHPGLVTLANSIQVISVSSVLNCFYFQCSKFFTSLCDLKFSHFLGGLKFHQEDLDVSFSGEKKKKANSLDWFLKGSIHEIFWDFSLAMTNYILLCLSSSFLLFFLVVVIR